MENVEERITELLESTNRFEIKADGLAGVPRESPLIRDRLAFAEPEDISLMQKYLGLPNDEVYTDDNIDTMHTLYIMAQKTGEPLYKFLVTLGNKIGGRMTDGFADKLRVYLRLLLEERNVNDAAKLLLGRKQIDKKQESEIDKILKQLKKEQKGK